MLTLKNASRPKSNVVDHANQTVNAMKTMSYNNVSYKNYLNFGQNYAN